MITTTINLMSIDINNGSTSINSENDYTKIMKEFQHIHFLYTYFSSTFLNYLNIFTKINTQLRKYLSGTDA